MIIIIIIIIITIIIIKIIIITIIIIKIIIITIIILIIIITIIIIIIVTGDSLRPDLLLISPNNCLYILKLTVGFETNLDINSHRKEEKYRPLLKDLNCDYRQVQFFNLFMSCLGIFGQSSNSFLEMCKCIGIDQSHLNYILNKISSIIIHTTYYIFCLRNKPWSNPELLSGQQIFTK